MKKVLIFLCLTLSAISLFAQDTIVRKNGISFGCSIDSVTITGINFRLEGSRTNNYLIAKSNVEKIYFRGKWQKIEFDSAKTAIEMQVLQNTPKAAPPNSLQSNGFLKKAGTNLIVGTAIPIGTGIIGGLLLWSENTRTVGTVIIGAGGIIGIVCYFSAGNNLIKAQKYYDQLLSKNGLTLSNPANGLGLAYRF